MHGIVTGTQINAEKRRSDTLRDLRSSAFICAVLICLLLLCLCSAAAFGQEAAIKVDLAAGRGAWRPVWCFFGYDEPNYTYMKHGRKLLGELAALSPVPAYIRAHNLLTSGDGTPALKWGSTNAYREDGNGRPIYDWTILDRIFDTYRDARVRPLVEIGFMPEALSIKPQPYRHTWPSGGISTGWAYPPKDYARWGELVHQWVRHAVERYGAEAVASWYWEVWNEPNIGYWRGSPEEYCKLYDYATDAVKRALPRARIGGPHSTGPGDPKAAAFLRAFLQHCLRGTNYATGKTGAPLDYIGFHAKGSPKMADGHVQMNIRKQAQDIAQGFAIVASFPELSAKPVIIGESDPEGCAACPATTHPQNEYRNGTVYPTYTAAMLDATLRLAERHGIRLEGAVTWAFEFEDQPWFAGFRTLATNGVDKPVLNVFRMFGLMRGERVQAESTAAAGLDAILEAGVRGRPDIGAIATRDTHEASILVWNYHDDDSEAQDAAVQLDVRHLPPFARRVQLRHYRIDRTHSNSYTVWKEMGSPQNPSPEQLSRLEAAAGLQLLAPPKWLWSDNGRVAVSFRLPRHAVSLLQLSY
jgi:xylan 1,4-beta-xylosidase